MPEIVAAHLERVAREVVSVLWHNDSHGVQNETVCLDHEACRRCVTESRVAAALAACAREEHDSLCPVCRNSLATISIKVPRCERGAALERAVGEKGRDRA